MNKEEFIIINKKTIQKRIERLKQSREVEPDNHQQSYLNGKIKVAEEILSQSTPLIPVLEDCYESGVDSLQDNLIQKLGLKYQTNEVSSTTINSTRGDLKDYIANLKLNI